MRSNTTRLLVRNVSHLGIGQVASTVLGVLLVAVLGRWLEPRDFGILYIVLTTAGFACVVVDWGQGTYLVREIARGRADEPELIGTALLIRMATTVLSTAIAVGIALAIGQGGEIATLLLLAMIVGIPATLFAPFSYAFRGKDRMHIDALANTVGKAVVLVATAIALRLGGGLTEVVLMQGIAGISALLVGAIAIKQYDMAVRPPGLKTFWELLGQGAPIAAFSLVIASQPFIETMILSAFAGPEVVGWYGASRNVLGIIVAPATIVLAASFPELSRASRSLPDFRRVMDATGRVLIIGAALSSSALYLFADTIVAVIYGHGRFEQTASILRATAIFLPLLFFGYLLASAMLAVGRNKAMAVISTVRIAVCSVGGWLLIGYWQQSFGNGAIALVVIAGVAEIPTVIACLALLPRGAVGSTAMLNWGRACITSVCTVVPLLYVKPLGLLYLVPSFAVLFALTAMITRLVSTSDLRLATELTRRRVLSPQSTSDA